MLTVAEAKKAIADAMTPLAAENIGIDAARGRILRQAVSAERDQPPFDRVTMDGIAVSFDAFEGGRRSFDIKGTQHAGDPVLQLAGPADCVEIMTGGVLPLGADCIVPVERISISGGVATIEDGYAATRRQFIHTQGSDHRAGHRVLDPGLAITPMDIAILASCGLETVAVNRQPVLRVVSTGNELIEPGRPIEPHQIRLSNGPALVAMMAEQGFTDSAHEHLADDPEALEERLGRLLGESDVLILSGGVSMGKADYVPGVLAALGVRPVFHKISQRPGKPMWFGVGQDGQAVFALPGNPVSTLVCCRHYVLPALFAAAGRASRSGETALLSEDVVFRPDLTCFLPVRVTVAAGGTVQATPVPTNTSGDFSSLTGTSGYVELAKDQCEFPAGSAVPLHRWETP